MAASLPQCSCVESAARAWDRISHIAEISLEIIVNAAAQTISFSLASQECTAHSSASALVVKDTLLQIYTRLVDFLRRALDTYTMTTATALQPPNAPEPGLTSTLWPLQLRQHAPLMEKQTSATAVGAFVCMPSRMALGDHELDEQQSRYLALDILFRTLKNIASALKQMCRQETAEIRTVDARVLAILLQVTRLIENTSATMHAPACQI